MDSGVGCGKDWRSSKAESGARIPAGRVAKWDEKCVYEQDLASLGYFIYRC